MKKEEVYPYRLCLCLPCHIKCRNKKKCDVLHLKVEDSDEKIEKKKKNRRGRSTKKGSIISAIVILKRCTINSIIVV